MESPAALLHTARTQAGLSVRALAALADVSPNTIIQIEKGRSDPSFGTLTHLLHTAGFELTGALRRRTIRPAITLASLASAQVGEEPDWTAWRAALDWLRQHPDELPAALRGRPKRTGFPHIDALLAGVAEKLADDAKLRRPAWTATVPPATNAWRPVGTPRMLARWERATPPQLRARNLVVDAESLWRRERASA